MIQIQLRKIYQEDFIKKDLKNLIRNLQIIESKKLIYQSMNQYLKETYKISLDVLITEVVSNLFLDKDKYSMSLKLNPAARDKKSNQQLIALVQLVDYGNLEIKGTLFFDKQSKFISRYLPTCYLLQAAANDKKKGEKNN